VRRLALLLLVVAQSATAGLRDVDFDPRPGAQAPLAVPLREGAREVRLDRYFAVAPVVLQLGYLGCENLCSTTLVGADEVLTRTGLTPERDYVALFVSIDPRDERSPPHRRPGWHVLTGAISAAAIARAVGFRYAYEESSGEYAHPAGFVLLTPEGRVASYFPGVRFDPYLLREAIERSRGAKPESAFERLLLVCFHDPVTGRNSDAALTALRVAAALFLAALGFLAWRKLR
jgi:protein SCO1/2